MLTLRERRLKAGLTQTELARRSGVAQPNIAAYEAGRRMASEGTLQKLTAALRPLPSEALRDHRDTIIGVLADHGMTNPRVFGSVAGSRDTPDSDLDLLVDAAPELDLLDIVDAADELERVLGVPVEIVTSRSLRPDHEIAATAVAV